MSGERTALLSFPSLFFFPLIHSLLHGFLTALIGRLFFLISLHHKRTDYEKKSAVDSALPLRRPQKASVCVYFYNTAREEIRGGERNTFFFFFFCKEQGGGVQND